MKQKLLSLNVKRYRYSFFAILIFLGLNLNAQQKQVMTVDFNAKGGVLKKPGLGDLFPVYDFGTSAKYKELVDGIFLNVVTSQGMADSYQSNIFSTDVVAPIIKGTDARLIARFNDMIPGFPYNWSTYGYWIDQVTKASQRIRDNYEDQVLCIEPFNEPDDKMQGNFMSDPAVQGDTYDEKINWLWTQTVNVIRRIIPDVPIMGPNYEDYYPFEDDGDQARMRAFLKNAVATGTTPDFIGWHKLRESPGDVPFALQSFYRPLEEELQVPGRPLPVVIDEFGPNTGDMEGVPGRMLKEMSELERARVDYGSMAIFTTSGQLGNTVRFPYDVEPMANAGWYTLHWYKEMKGEYVPTSRWDQRYYQAYDGIASYDDDSKTATVILGGSNDLADVQLKGIGNLIGNKVRVQVQCAYWDVYPLETEASVENGGDAGKPYVLFDKTFTCGANGDLSVPLYAIQEHNGYRILVTPIASAEATPTKIEAEDAVITGGSVVGNTVNASGDAFVTNLASAGSSATFTVNAPYKGIFSMLVRYAATGPVTNTQAVMVNDVPQGSITYPNGVMGNAADELLLTKKKLALEKGSNTISLNYKSGNVQLDFIDVRPDLHRYDAEYATINHVRKAFYNRLFTGFNYIGGIDFDDSYVEFAVNAPKADDYTAQIGYANNLDFDAVPIISLNGEQIDQQVIFTPTDGWLDAAPSVNASREVKEITLTLTQGINRIRIAKGEGFAELDFLKVFYGDPANLGLADVQRSDFDFKVYPNPASAKISLKYTASVPGDYSTEVYNILGAQVEGQKLSGNGQDQLDISDLSAGIYLVKIIRDGKTVGIKKMLKK